MSLLGVDQCVAGVAYTNSLLPLVFVYSNQPGVGGHLCPLAMPVTVVQPGFVNGKPKRGSKATERRRVWEGGFHGREIFENSCMKTTFSWRLCPLHMPYIMICQREAKAKRPSGGGCGSCCFFPRFFKNLCMKTTFSCTLNAIIRCSLCRGIYQFLTPPFFIYSNQREGWVSTCVP